MTNTNFIELYEKSFKKNWDLQALSDLNDATTYTYGELAQEIARMHILFEEMGVIKGDKVALVGSNHSSWAIVIMATLSYGATIVLALSDFHPNSIENIILHSDAKVSFIDQTLWKNIDNERITHPVFALPSLKLLQADENFLNDLHETVDEKFSMKYSSGFQIEDVKYPHVPNGSVVCINYISGSPTFLRGVMLTGTNFLGNLKILHKLKLLNKKDGNVAFLPFAHAFSCTLDLLYGLTVGAHLHIVNRMGNFKMLLNAFQQVKPKLINTVPAILELIVRRERDQIINTPLSKFLLKLPLLNKIVHNKIRKSIFSIFGGSYRELYVGGARLDEEIEDFLIKIKFPFSVGYGMTECAPIISIDTSNEFVPRSCGKVVKESMQARIRSVDPETIPGEIQVKGTHVMAGYYKDPEATSAVFTDDGWLKTGDLGLLDKNNRLYIKGLLKTMILGSDGQNIYPTEIEAVLNKMDYVSESIVVDRKGSLVALVYPDHFKLKKDGLNFSGLEKVMKEHRKELNKRIARYERIMKIELMEDEFERTEDRIIKREQYV